MRLEAYLLLLFCISMVFYFLGYQPLLLQTMFNQQNGQFLDPATIMKNIFSAMVSPTGPMTAIGATLIIAAVVAAALGFAAIYILPALILLVILNLFVFPLSFLVQSTDPSTAFFFVPFVVLMNLLTVLAYVNFIRGGGV